jgi:inorganic pyrophosphatase
VYPQEEKRSRAIQELEKFFEATNALEAKTLKFQGWRGPAKAIKTIKKSRRPSMASSGPAAQWYC